MTTGAQERWAGLLAAWALPEELIARAPEHPYRFDVARFARFADEARPGCDPSQLRAREALPEGGVLLDIGCGAGAASLPLIPPAAHVTGVDPQDDMLEAFRERIEAAGARATTVLGGWPEVADHVGVADVAVSRHVLYNIPDLAAFATALTEQVRRRVVIELSQRHPLDWTRPYWRALHGVDRPEGPTSTDAAAALAEAGVAVEVEHWVSRHQLADEDAEAQLASLRHRLLVDPERDGELRALLAEHPPPAERPVTTLWWNTTSTWH